MSNTERRISIDALIGVNAPAWIRFRSSSLLCRATIIFIPNFTTESQRHGGIAEPVLRGTCRDTAWPSLLSLFSAYLALKLRIARTSKIKTLNYSPTSNLKLETRNYKLETTNLRKSGTLGADFAKQSFINVKSTFHYVPF